ncbi:RluA family pseudouridine synthase [Clostridium beijerinckii]|jgi:pseudouridine synthase, RluA family|uniref:Pseudouridine synthase n=2 Tax=Clostridium beijerinckii TaxID=1520 RepID=A0AAE2RP36_CLOBE|nr:RluA family pseudouridine synthase [Clostridium beijerinckii]ABR32704.1 pseudouridine synthase, RluA family [Clostridium beijerinckii NCIMB 8052]AIU04535.1 RluA family pseudouridine synthase [Clostridium beijerinckii ATCC 35702]MBF7807616.1 RluA family pseudouridine synthase [Clostridium beijerinckii]NRT26063.1 23S rRNA pseudouridine1911/1915/1917 synthase [Clostridium beijerinckii]NRT66336.1 23S rRNA pseudouridine1911/1915/1917 synthase [Clostridium beijerinckii]
MSILEKQVVNIEKGTKIREYLKVELGLSTRLIRSASLGKRIFVNDEVVKMNRVLNEGEIIKIDLAKDESQDIAPEKMDIDIVYEDEDILVVNKKPFMVVHPTKSYQSGTLANGVINYFMESGQNCIVRLVSRLDMNTSGLIIIAKNQFSHGMLSKEMSENKVEKKYLALVHGIMKEKQGTIDLPIYKPEGIENGIRRVVDERGQRSITHYKVVEEYNESSLVECKLETGRTHQIRVHLSHLGHPIYGDTLYGDGDEEDLIKRQALHAFGLDFKSPRSGEILSLRAELPDDMKELISKLK